jgi:protease I
MGASTNTRELKGRSDEAVFVDAGLVTSRSPVDMDAFLSKMLEEIREGVHAAQHA